jgi:hypothetical protein
MPKHFIWWLLTMACVIWYIAITWYVTIKGARDIKDMLSDLKHKANCDKSASENTK